MSHNATVSYLDENANNSNSPTKSLTGRLRDALKNYQSNSDLHTLKVGYTQQLDYEASLKEKEMSMTIHNFINGFRSFNIAPSNSYERYLSVLENKTDSKATFSDWQMVGDDLSFALMKHLLESNEYND